MPLAQRTGSEPRARGERQRAREQGIGTPVRAFGVPRQFLPHATREEIVDALRLRPHDIAADTLAALDELR